MTLISARLQNPVERADQSFSLESKRRELARARTLARAWAQALHDQYRSRLAAIFAQTAMEAFAEKIAPNLDFARQLKVEEQSLDATTEQLARSIGIEVASLPLLEGCHFLTSLYTTLLPPKQRSDLGAFYTPASLNKRLLDLADEGGVDWATARVLDPASGGGAHAHLYWLAARADRQALHVPTALRQDDRRHT